MRTESLILFKSKDPQLEQPIKAYYNPYYACSDYSANQETETGGACASIRL